MAEDRRASLPKDNMFRQYENQIASVPDEACGELGVQTSFDFEAQRNSLNEGQIRTLFRAMDAPGTATRNLADAKRRFW